MNTTSVLENPPTNIDSTHTAGQSDLTTAGYIRLLSSILDEPAESIAVALRTPLPIVAALGADENKAA